MRPRALLPFWPESVGTNKVNIATLLEEDAANAAAFVARDCSHDRESLFGLACLARKRHRVLLPLLPLAQTSETKITVNGARFGTGTRLHSCEPDSSIELSFVGKVRASWLK